MRTIFEWASTDGSLILALIFVMWVMYSGGPSTIFDTIFGCVSYMTSTPVTYSFGDSNIVLVQNPADKNFSVISSDSTSVYVPDVQNYVYRDKYRYTPAADEYNRYVTGIGALNEYTKNKHGSLAENEQYCHIMSDRKTPLLSNTKNPARMDANTLVENNYDQS